MMISSKFSAYCVHILQVRTIMLKSVPILDINRGNLKINNMLDENCRLNNFDSGKITLFSKKYIERRR